MPHIRTEVKLGKRVDFKGRNVVYYYQDLSRIV